MCTFFVRILAKNNYYEGMLLLWNMYIRPKNIENA